MGTMKTRDWSAALSIAHDRFRVSIRHSVDSADATRIAQEAPSMSRSFLIRSIVSTLAIAGVGSLAFAQTGSVQDVQEPDWIAPDPLSESLMSMPWDVKLYNQHITTLANPFFEGRAPGLRGNRDAANYIQFYLERAGMKGAFGSEGNPASFRQEFQPRSQQLSGTGSMSWNLSFSSGAVQQKSRDMVYGEDFVVTPYSASETVDGPVVFAGYSIEDGQDGYTSFPEGADLNGAIALIFRFEPMDDKGNSKWAESGWSPKAGFIQKLRAVTSRGAKGIIVVNAPGANDPRVDSLLDANGGQSMGGSMKVPVMMMSIDAARRLTNETSGLSLDDLRVKADQAGLVVPLNATVTMSAEVTSGKVTTDNVAGVLRGSGDLADQYIVIGAHYDHVGYGKFGTSTPDVLHPGADDNGSGTSACLVLAESLGRMWSNLPANEPRRSVVIALFSAEESGLEGSRNMVQNLPMPIENIYTMVNMDMVGRLREGRIDVQGMESADGLEAIVWPILEASGMTPVKERPTGNSDHASFRNAGVPIVSLFTGYHDVYHTPGDVSETINRVGAVKIVRTVQDIVMVLATHAGKLSDPAPSKSVASAQTEPRNTDRFGASADDNEDQPRGRGGSRVRFGVMPGDYEGITPGVLIDEVFPGTTAENAGLRSGDRMIEWNGKKLDSVQDWMPFLAEARAGDKVEIVYLRQGERRTTTATLLAADGE